MMLNGRTHINVIGIFCIKHDFLHVRWLKFGHKHMNLFSNMPIFMKQCVFLISVVNICEQNPCGNGGICTGSPSKPCDCPPGWSGTYCRVGKYRQSHSFCKFVIVLYLHLIIMPVLCYTLRNFECPSVRPSVCLSVRPSVRLSAPTTILVSATPPTVLGQSFWNFTGVLRMVWRYAYCFFRILKLFFITFFPFLT